MAAILDAYQNREAGTDYKEAVIAECRSQLKKILKLSAAVPYAVAAGKDTFLWDVLYDEIDPHVKKVEVKKNAE